MLIREITLEDGQAFLDLLRQLDRETNVLLLEPGEREDDVESLGQEIARVHRADNKAIFVADDGEELKGYIAAEGGEYKRNYRTVYLVIAVKQDSINQGLGKKLFSTMEDWAKKQGIHRLELTVMTHNTPAVHLYRSRGFVIEGVRRQGLKVGDAFVDEYYMGKILSAT